MTAELASRDRRRDRDDVRSRSGRLLDLQPRAGTHARNAAARARRGQARCSLAQRVPFGDALDASDADFPIRYSSRPHSLFALLFVVVSMLATLAQSHLGARRHFRARRNRRRHRYRSVRLESRARRSRGIGLTTAASAIVIATSSNNVLKAIYTIAFSRGRESVLPAAMLGLVAVLGIACALLLIR